MTDVAELERRITAALERIGTGLERLHEAAPAAVATGEDDALTGLQEELQAEKEASAQLEERLKAVRRKLQGEITGLEDQLDGIRRQARDAEVQMQRLRKANQQLRQSLQALRESAAKGSPEPHLINQAMLSELEGLRALREGDRSEMDAILGELKPLLEEPTDA